VAAVIFAGLIFLGASAPAYGCSFQLDPAPSPSVAPSGSPVLGQIEDDMGHTHIDPGTLARYTFCPPASGVHYNLSGQGPIPPRLYGPDDPALPMGWIHNLEHGGLVILYNCNAGGCDQSNQDQLKALIGNFPNSPICQIPSGTYPKGQLSPVIARFDQMKTPFAALVWGRVLFQDKLDTAQILEFFSRYAERTNPEKICASPSPGASPSFILSPGAPEPTGPPAVEPGATASPSGT
jgi:hypothetical protein